MDTADRELDAALVAGDGLRSRRLISSYRSSVSDEVVELLARHAAGGSLLAVELLVEAIDATSVARRFVGGLLLDDTAIDEVTQDVLVSVAAGIRTFRGEAKFTTWLHRVARNRTVDYLRRQRAATLLDEGEHGAAYRMSSMIATRETVRELLARLPEMYRAAVTLRDVDGLSYEEVAARLGRNVNTVKSHVARGRAMVAAMLGEDAL